MTTLRGLLVLTLLAFTQGAMELNAGSQTKSDVDVKATFILNFIRMVNWKKNDGEETSQLAVCALGGSDLFTALRYAAKNKTVENRPIVSVLAPQPLTENCQVLVFESTDYPRAAQILRHLRKAPVLTVGDGPGFMEIGGMFELSVEKQKVQFDVSLPVVKDSGLEISARLLRLSKSFRSAGPDAY